MLDPFMTPDGEGGNHVGGKGRREGQHMELTQPIIRHGCCILRCSIRPGGGDKGRLGCMVWRYGMEGQPSKYKPKVNRGPWNR